MCTIYDPTVNIVLEGVRTSENWYDVIPNFKYMCSNTKIDMTELWYQRLGSCEL